MSKTLTILLICCLAFLSGPAAVVLAQPAPVPLASGCGDSQNCKSFFVPMVGKSSSFRAGEGYKACLMVDGPVNDQGFNALAWKGVQDAVQKHGVNGVLAENTSSDQYGAVINGFIAQKCSLILTVGFMVADATQAAAEANPDQKFAIVDVTYDPPISNLRGMSFAVDQPSFLAGYLAAGMTQTGKVATFGGLNIPVVTAFMNGFYYGVQYYNYKNGASIQVLGWDPVTQTGAFIDSFGDTAAGTAVANAQMTDGADIILPVAGAAGLGAAAAVQAHGNAWLIGVDGDWTVTAPQYSSVILTSVMKLINAPVYQAISDVIDGKFTGGTYMGTLANGGVGLGTTASAVPPVLASQLNEVKAGIVDGTIPTNQLIGQGKKVCLVTDGPVSDPGFNGMAWAGIQAAKVRLGIQDVLQESVTSDNLAAVIDGFIADQCDLILTANFTEADATLAAAEANPNQKFAIVDFMFDPPIPNLRSMIFRVDQSAFLAGYMAAGMTKTGKVGTFGGLNIPFITTFMDGFYDGVQYYNQQKSANVEVLGWDPSTWNGLFSGTFTDQAKGSQLAQTLMSEGADIIFPAAGETGLGAADAVHTSGNAWVIGTDTDWTLTASQYSDVILTSVLKKADVVTYQAIADMAGGQFTGGTYEGTLRNNGTRLGVTSMSVLDWLMGEVDQIAVKIMNGTLTVNP